MANRKKEENIVFMEYNGECPPCAFCVFAEASEDACDRHPCRPFDREDGKYGYYRAANVMAISYPDPKGGKNER